MPFTQEAFLGVFASYNQVLWPAALALWVATAAVFVAFIAGAKMWQPLPFLMLAILWLWAGLAYHALFFTKINPAAWVFAALFVAQGIMLLVVARSRRTVCRPPSGWRRSVSSGLIIYAFAYPAIVLADGFAYPRMPTYGVPCPTTILTMGFLLAVSTRSYLLAAVPVAWSLIAGSAAWLYGVHADLILPAAGVVLAIDLALKRSHVMRKRSVAGVLAFLIVVPVFVPASTAFASPDQHQHEQQAAAAPGGGAKMGEMKMAGMQMGEMMQKNKANTERLNALMARVKSSSGDAKVTAMADVIAVLLEERAAMQEHCATACSMMKK
jgi:Family of unknown function (DUF6064)